MKSHEVLRKVIKDGNAKEIADALGTSQSNVYKWSQDGESHRKNPLERLVGLIRATNDMRVLHWLCEQHNGYFVQNPAAKKRKPLPLSPAQNMVVHQFAEMIALISKAASDNAISEDESRKISERWEHLKSLAEGFVNCCRNKNFAPFHNHEVVHAQSYPRATAVMAPARV